MADFRFEIEWRPRRQICLACGEEFPVVNIFNLNCPKCRQQCISCISGTELDIAYLEVEDVCAKS